MYRLHHLVTLQAVCRTGSFALAARELAYTPSAVSQQIATLERELGLPLFEREAHSVRATAAAERVVELSRPLLAGLDEFDRGVRALAAGHGARLGLGSFPTASVHLVPAIMAACRDRVPGAEIRLGEGEPDELIDSVVDGDLDVALVYEYGLCPRRWPDGLSVEPIAREDLFVLSPVDDRAPARLDQLRDRRWIASREGTAGALSLTRLCAAAGFVPQVSHRSNNYDVVRELVIATGGSAVVPQLGHSEDARITATRLTQRRAHRTVLMVHRSRNLNPLVGNLLEIVRAAPGSPHAGRAGLAPPGSEPA